MSSMSTVITLSSLINKFPSLNNSLKNTNTSNYHKVSVTEMKPLLESVLKCNLNILSSDKKKPFSISIKNHLMIISYPSHMDTKHYDEWYEIISDTLNEYFYRKEPDDDDDIIPSVSLRNRLFMDFNKNTIELEGNIVIKGLPIFDIKKKKKKKTDKIKLPENTEKDVSEMKKKISKIKIMPSKINTGKNKFNDSDTENDDY